MSQPPCVEVVQRFFSPTAKEGAAHKKRGAARLAVKKTELTGKMCASATFHHLFYALVGIEPGKNVKCCLSRGDSKECPLYTHNTAVRL